MSDAAIQGALQTLIRALANFADADVTKGDFRVLGRGSAPYAIILPGPLAAERTGGWSQVTIAWTHYAEVWDRFSGDDYSGITTARQALADQINRYPTLDGLSGITNCWASASGETLFLWQKGQARIALPSFVGFRITVTTIEEVLYAGGGEFA